MTLLLLSFPFCAAMAVNIVTSVVLFVFAVAVICLTAVCFFNDPVCACSRVLLACFMLCFSAFRHLFGLAFVVASRFVVVLLFLAP